MGVTALASRQYLPLSSNRALLRAALSLSTREVYPATTSSMPADRIWNR